MRLNVGSASLTAFILVTPLALAAQTTRTDSAQRDSLAAKLRAVTVTATRAAGIVGGASAVIIRPTELRSSPAPLLEQALRESPFVHVRQNSRGEMELSVRGSDSRQAAVLYDGVPITLGWDNRTDPSLVPITGASRLVIVRGLGSLLNGPNTLGGTIEVMQDRTGTAPTGIWVGGGVDENSAFVTTLGGARRFGEAPNGSFFVQGGFAYRDRDGFALPDGAVDSTARDGLRTNSDLKHLDAFASARWNGRAGRSVGLTMSGFDAERGVPPEEHISSPRLWRYPYHRRTITALSGSTGSFKSPFGFGSLDIGAGFNSGRVKIETFSDRTYRTVTAEELGYERTLSARALLTHSLAKAATLRAGFTNADVQYTETVTPGVDDEYRQKMWSAGAEIEAPIVSRTTIAGGLVYDNTRTPETGGRTAQEPFDNIGWRAGLTHQVSDAWRVHATASQRSRFPALRELYSGALNRFLPNPDLKPETLLGFEAGFTSSARVGKRSEATLEATGFHHTLDDAVARITLPAPDRRFKRINRDRIESSGVELLAGFIFGDNRARAVTITGDALLQSVSIHDVTLAGQPARHSENNPETRASVELGLPLPLALRGAANVRYTGKQFCLNEDTGNEMALKAQARTDLALERSFFLSANARRSVRTLVSLDNVANATVYDQCGLPQPGRTLRVMFTLR